MSTTHNSYIMFGVLLPFDFAGEDDDTYEMTEPYFPDGDSVNHKGNVTVIYDGMGGKYIALGHVIARTEDYQGFYNPIVLGLVSQTTTEWQADIDKVLGDFGLEKREATWIVLTDYS